MTRRRLLLVAALLAILVFLGYVALHLALPTSRLNAADFQKIKLGMTESEVEEVLGVPAGDYGTLELLKPMQPRLGEREKAWCDDEWVLFLSFDENGIVTAQKQVNWNLHPSLKGVEGLVHRLRRRLGW